MLVFLVGCATSLPTNSGRPEAVIAAPRAQVKSAIVHEMLAGAKGWSLVQEGEFLVVFERDAGLGASFFLGSIADPTVWQQFRVQMVDREAATEVYANVTLRHGAHLLGDNSGSYQKAQHLLRCIKADLEHTPRPPAPPPEPATPPAAGARR